MSSTKSVDVGRRMTRLLRGIACRWRLDRRDVSPMVHSLSNFGELRAALAACKAVLVTDPQNVYAYVHLIDLNIRCLGNFAQGQKYHQLGVTNLLSDERRELLESFYLYTCCMNFPLLRLFGKR